MKNSQNSAENQLLTELSKAEMAILFHSNSIEIKEMKAKLKKLEAENLKLESILLPQIQTQYKPKGQNFILRRDIAKGKNSVGYANVVKEAPKLCKLTTNQIAIFKDLITKHSKMAKDKPKLEVI